MARWVVHDHDRLHEWGGLGCFSGVLVGKEGFDTFFFFSVEKGLGGVDLAVGGIVAW